ncbi:MAG: hypothetical protein ABR936_15655 [Bacteroidota bacterium]|jgi:hypothetical protein
MSNIEESKFSEIINILNKYDISVQVEEFIQSEQDAILIDPLNYYMNQNRYNKHSVLGIDIYRYSKYPELQQYMIPVIFKELYRIAVGFCIIYEPFVFQKFKDDDFNNSFISTGDGGFQIFPTPIHALIFTIYFEASLRAFNLFCHYPKLRSYLGEISLRYTLTYDNIFHFDHNFFGPAIINNSRILSKDHLNRFLIDASTYGWFLKKTGGVETLLNYDVERLSKISDFKDYDNSFIEKKHLLFPTKYDSKKSIRLINVQKVGLLDVKGDTVDIHSVYIQVDLSLLAESTIKEKKDFILSLGNTNSSGI